MNVSFMTCLDAGVCYMTIMSLDVQEVRAKGVSGEGDKRFMMAKSPADFNNLGWSAWLKM